MSTPPRIRALVTLGPTYEALDAIRFIGNRSSGRMGLQIAKALQQAGCEVRVLAGVCQPDGLDSLPHVERFRTAEQLRDLLTAHWPAHDVLVMAAAVADWRAKAPEQGKYRRGSGEWMLALEPVPEILGSLQSRRDQFIIGFALEPQEELLDSARRKLQRKRADCIVANLLETMDSSSICGSLLWTDGRVQQPAGAQSKVDFAHWLTAQVLPAVRTRCGDTK